MPKNDDRIVLTVSGQGEKVSGFGVGFWLMFVTGFNPDQHCLACLRGHKEKRVKRDMRLNLPVNLSTYKGPYSHIYLCGVAGRWSNNLHLVAVPEPGALAEKVTYNGLQVTITNTHAVEIPPLPDGYREMPAAYTTCRNWQFGVHFYGFPAGWQPPAEALAARNYGKRRGRFGGGCRAERVDAIVFGEIGSVDARAFQLAPLVGQVDDDVYQVPSTSGNDPYTVTLGERPQCSCKHGEHWNFAGARCVHVAAARVAKGDIKSAQPALFPEIINPLQQRRNTDE